MMAENEENFSRKQAAIYLTSIGCRISAGTLENMACNNNAGGGPPFTRFRWKTVVYRKSDLDKWAKGQSERVE